MSKKRDMQYSAIQTLFGDILDRLNLEEFLKHAISLQIFDVTRIKKRFFKAVQKGKESSERNSKEDFNSIVDLLEVFKRHESCLDEFIQILSAAVQQNDENEDHKILLSKLKQARSTIRNEESEVPSREVSVYIAHT